MIGARRCGACAKIRGAVVRAWSTVTRPRHRYCVIGGCSGTYPICRRHWSALPLEMRQRWWRETSFSGQPPSQTLIEAVNKRLGAA